MGGCFTLSLPGRTSVMDATAAAMSARIMSDTGAWRSNRSPIRAIVSDGGLRLCEPQRLGPQEVARLISRHLRLRGRCGSQSRGPPLPPSLTDYNSPAIEARMG